MTVADVSGKSRGKSHSLKFALIANRSSGTQEEKRMKAYAVILRTNDEPEDVADKIDSLGYAAIQIDEINESEDNPYPASEVVWQA